MTGGQNGSPPVAGTRRPARLNNHGRRRRDGELRHMYRDRSSGQGDDRPAGTTAPSSSSTAGVLVARSERPEYRALAGSATCTYMLARCINARSGVCDAHTFFAARLGDGDDTLGTLGALLRWREYCGDVVRGARLALHLLQWTALAPDIGSHRCVRSAGNATTQPAVASRASLGDDDLDDADWEVLSTWQGGLDTAAEPESQCRQSSSGSASVLHPGAPRAFAPEPADRRQQGQAVPQVNAPDNASFAPTSKAPSPSGAAPIPGEMGSDPTERHTAASAQVSVPAPALAPGRSMSTLADQKPPQPTMEAQPNAQGALFSFEDDEEIETETLAEDYEALLRDDVDATSWHSDVDADTLPLDALAEDEEPLRLVSDDSRSDFADQEMDAETLDWFFDDLDESPSEEELRTVRTLGRVNRDERARQVAIDVGLRHDWPEEGIALLARVFRRHYWSAARVAMEREMARGMTPEELALAIELREFWERSPEFSMCLGNGRGWRLPGGSTTADRYRILSWPASLRLVRLFAGEPQLEELTTLIDELFECWSDCSRYQLACPSFHHFIYAWLAAQDDAAPFIPPDILWAQDDPAADHDLDPGRVAARLNFFLVEGLLPDQWTSWDTYHVSAGDLAAAEDGARW